VQVLGEPDYVGRTGIGQTLLYMTDVGASMASRVEGVVVAPTGIAGDVTSESALGAAGDCVAVGGCGAGGGVRTDQGRRVNPSAHRTHLMSFATASSMVASRLVGF
jgi:hypothetical protein